LHGTLVLVVDVGDGDVVVVVEVLDVVVLVDGFVVDELVVEVASLGGPVWQWLVSPWP